MIHRVLGLAPDEPITAYPMAGADHGAGDGAHADSREQAPGFASYRSRAGESAGPGALPSAAVPSLDDASPGGVLLALVLGGTLSLLGMAGLAYAVEAVLGWGR